MLALGMCPESFEIKPPAAPGVNEVITLFDSAAMFWPKCLRHMQATMLEVTFEVLSHDSAASGLVAYTSSDGGTTYTQNNIKNDSGTDTMPVTISATDDPRTYRFVLTPYSDFQLKYTSATAPTGWTLTIVLHCGGLAVSR